MITDPVPCGERSSREYSKSDRLAQIPLPEAGPVRERTARLVSAMGSEQTRVVRDAAAELVDHLVQFYEVPAAPVRILGVRPHRVRAGTCTYQLFGDYSPDSHRIRVWMRTAIKERVSTPKSLLATLLHEFCHHLDCTALGCPTSLHTRGFYARIDELYHLALGTPHAERRPLRWTKRGSVWAIDWQKSRSAAMGKMRPHVRAVP
jgi:hypothetical protein